MISAHTDVDFSAATPSAQLLFRFLEATPPRALARASLKPPAGPTAQEAGRGHGHRPPALEPAQSRRSDRGFRLADLGVEEAVGWCLAPCASQSHKSG